ncbi:unnamed protein product, partial [Polarella glacialis]
HRSKIAEYHQESFRRVKSRGSRRSLRVTWEDFNWWMMREHKEIEGGLQPAERAQHVETFFSSDARIHFCNIKPEVEEHYKGSDGVLRFLPFLAKLVTENKQDVHLPSEEAEEDPRTIIIGLANSCTVVLLFDQENKIARATVFCASCECHDEVPDAAGEKPVAVTKSTRILQDAHGARESG